MRLDPPLAPFRSTRSGRLARSNTGPLEERPSAALRLPRVLMLTYVVRFRPCSSIRTRRIVPRTIGRKLVVAIWHAPPRSAPTSPRRSTPRRGPPPSRYGWWFRKRHRTISRRPRTCLRPFCGACHFTIAVG